MLASEKAYALVECTRSAVGGELLPRNGGTGLEPRRSSHSAGYVSIGYFPTEQRNHEKDNPGQHRFQCFCCIYINYISKIFWINI